uniref:Uncharacterized protein n=1 Tax=Pelusios castaneus TaxID=367368 RepID=A0A8C8RLX8_9SAUR
HTSLTCLGFPLLGALSECYCRLGQLRQDILAQGRIPKLPTELCVSQAWEDGGGGRQSTLGLTGLTTCYCPIVHRFCAQLPPRPCCSFPPPAPRVSRANQLPSGQETTSPR